MAVSSSSMWRKSAKVYHTTREIQILQSTRTRSLDPEDQAKRAEQIANAQKELKTLQGGFELNVQLLLGMLLGVTIVLAILRALPEGNWLNWLIATMPATGSDVEFEKVLTPLLAIAIAIERLLETGFNWFEQTSIAVADVLVAPKEALDWAGREYQEAYKATEEAAEIVGADMTPDNLQLLHMAENRLSVAEQRLRGWTGTPEYIAFKKAISIWLGLLGGLCIAVLGDIKMLSMVNIPTPRIVDMLVTGLVIGAGSGPMHDLIGILQGGKMALNNLAEIAKGRPVQEAISELEQRVAEAQHGIPRISSEEEIES